MDAKKLEKQFAMFDSIENLGICYTWTLVCENKSFKRNIYNSILEGKSIKPLENASFLTFRNGA